MQTERRKTKSKGNNWVSWFAMVLLFGILLDALVPWLQYRSWREVNARVTKVDVVHYQGTAYDCLYRYRVDGEEYLGELIGAQTRPGERITVRYDPKDPARSMAENPVSLSGLLIPLAMFLLTCCLNFRDVKRWLEAGRS